MGRLPPLPLLRLPELPEPSPPRPSQPSVPTMTPAHSALRPGEACPFLGHPGPPLPRGGRAQAPGPAGLGPAQSRSGPCAQGCRSRSSPGCPRRAGGGGYPYLSGLFLGPVAAQLQEPMSVRGARPLSPEGGRGSRGGGWGTRAALAPSHAPRPAPGRGRTAPPPAPAHRLTPALTHTLTLPRALSHTHSPPSSCSVYLLQLSGDPGEAQHRACATQSPPPPRASQPAATLRRQRPAVSRMAIRGPPTHPPLPAPGQRLLPAAPTNLLVGEPRTAAANPLRRSPDRQPVGGRKSWARPWGILGVVVFLRRRTPAARAHPAQLPLVTRTRLLSYIHVKCSLLSLLGHSPHPLPPEADTVSQQPSQDFLRAP